MPIISDIMKMNNLTQSRIFKLLTLAALLFSPLVVQAELDRPDSSLFVADGELPDKKSSLMTSSSSFNNAAIPEPNGLDKQKLLRCWQYGQLIVAENGFSSPGAEGETILTKTGERLTGFDFGETFCLYQGS